MSWWADSHHWWWFHVREQEDHEWHHDVHDQGQWQGGWPGDAAVAVVTAGQHDSPALRHRKSDVWMKESSSCWWGDYRSAKKVRKSIEGTGKGVWMGSSLLDEWKRITDRREESIDFFFLFSLLFSASLIVEVCMCLCCLHVNVSVYLWKIFAYWSLVLSSPKPSLKLGSDQHLFSLLILSFLLFFFFCTAPQLPVVTFFNLLRRWRRWRWERRGEG